MGFGSAWPLLRIPRSEPGLITCRVRSVTTLIPRYSRPALAVSVPRIQDGTRPICAGTNASIAEEKRRGRVLVRSFEKRSHSRRAIA
jgi:hypothetical protein